MKKNTIKAFTLVEMLIVIVIIGILIASLMPRMQSAQGRARDVARKNDLSQIQTAIITSQQDKGVWPQLNSGAKNGMAVSGGLETDLLNAGMTQIPKDPNGSNVVKGLKGGEDLDPGSYGYMVTTRNSVEDGGFVLMAKTEVEGSSNWVVCGVGTGCAATSKTSSGEKMSNCGVFVEGVDLKDIKTCTSFTKSTESNKCQNSGGTCTYSDDGELAYILVY